MTACKIQIHLTFSFYCPLRIQTYICYIAKNLTSLTHRVSSGGACFSPSLICPLLGNSLHRLFFSFFLGTVHSWGILCLVLSVGDTRAQSAWTNNYCTEGRAELSRWNQHTHSYYITEHKSNGMRIIHFWNNKDQRKLLPRQYCALI